LIGIVMLTVVLAFVGIALTLPAARNNAF